MSQDAKKKKLQRKESGERYTYMKHTGEILDRKTDRKECQKYKENVERKTIKEKVKIKKKKCKEEI